MPPSVRIALVEREPSGVGLQLRELPGRPDVREFADLYEDYEALRGYAPHALLVEAGQLAAEDIGALRLLGRAVPGLWIVLIAPREREVELAAAADLLGAQLLLRPFEVADLAAVVASVGPGAPRASPATFLDIARGISDEINNPLLFAGGHLQLLAAMLEERGDQSMVAQLRAIQEGLDRITGTMAKIRLLGDARARRGPWRTFQLAPILRSVAATARVDADLEDVEITGDERLVGAAIAEFVAVGGELAERADAADWSLETVPDGLRVRLRLSGLAIPDWQLPRAFEPYYLNRILRGTTHGLGLFLVHTIVQAHGGTALARRRADGTVVMDLLLPRATDLATDTP